MGGRGTSSGNLGKKSGIPMKYEKYADIWSYRHNKKNEVFVDNVNQTLREMGETFTELNSVINDVYIAKMSGKNSRSVMAFWGLNGELGINKHFGNVDKMAKSYANDVKQGWHPSNGNKTAEQAVIAHELGHSLTTLAQQKTGAKSFDDVAHRIMKDSQKILNKQAGKRKYQGTKKIANAISGYAKENNAECIAEATADVYCNGKKAKTESKAIVKALKNLIK